jgi:hypothetical protein
MRILVLLSLTLFYSMPARALTYEDLVSFIETGKAKTISELLSRLPAEYRSEFTLMMRSRSLQDASSESPRVIMSGIDAKLIIAFNGDSRQKGFDKLEVIQFRDGTARFDFFEIQFPEKDDQGRPLNSLTRPQTSARNPAKCLSCHTSDPRPNWQHYNQWPGAFMGNDDFGNLEPELPSLEAYKKVIASDFPKHPRYKFLDKALEGYSESTTGRPTERNIKMTQRISVQNFKRVARLMKTDPYYEAYKYLVVGLMNCPDLPNFVPAGFPVYTYRRDRFGQPDFADIFVQRQLFVGDYFTDFKVATPFFTIPGQLMGPLTYPFMIGDADLESLAIFQNDYKYGMETPVAGQVRCAELMAKSKRALVNVPNPRSEISERNSARPAILNKCLSCHSSFEMTGPHIPLDNTVRLKTHLKLTGYTRGTFFDELIYRISESASEKERMPPQGISKEDRQALTEYLKILLDD